MGVLLMLMTIGGLIAAALLLAIGVFTGKAWLRRFVVGGVAVWFAFYGVMLLAYSLTSTERTLALNEPKAYCGFYLDCHLHTAVTGVRTMDVIGGRHAEGVFYVVSVKVFSDAKLATLAMTNVDASIIDADGRRYARDLRAESGLPPQPDLDGRIAPMESFVREIVFDLPGDVREPRLDLAEGLGIDRVIESVLVGDEDSIFHKRQYFAISDQAETAGVN